MLRTNPRGNEPERTVSTAHLDGAVSPGKAAKNPQELVAFLRAKRRSGGSQTPRRAPSMAGSMAGSMAQAPAAMSGGSPPPPPPMPLMMMGGPPPPALPPGMLFGGNNQLLSEIEQAAQARAAARQVPQGPIGVNSQLLFEIEQAAQARAAQRAGQPVPGGGLNPLLEEIRAAGGSPRGRIDQWLAQDGNPGLDQHEEIRLGESAVSPVMTASRSASPPPPSAHAGAHGKFSLDDHDGPVNYVQELLMQHGLVERKRTSVVSAQHSQGHQSQLQPTGHVAKLLMRHQLHDIDDPVAMAHQISEESMRVLQTIQTYPSFGYPQQPYSQPQYQQQNLGPVPGASAPQTSIWERLHDMSQTQPPVHSQGAPGPNDMMLPYTIRAPGPLLPTTSMYQTLPGRSTFTVRLQKRDMPGGRRSFGMKINWNEYHRRIEVTEVVPSTFHHATHSSVHLLVCSATLTLTRDSVCLQTDRPPRRAFR